VQDAACKWQRSTYPKTGDQVELQIGFDGASLWPCGTFTVDEFDFSSPPDLMIIKCVENWITQPMRTPTSQGFENMTVLEIAQAIASKYGWELVTNGAVAPDVTYERKTQGLQTDLAYLHELANEHNYEVQIRPPQLIFASRTTLEGQAPAGPAISRKQTTHVRFRSQTAGVNTYGGAAVSYLDPSTKQTWAMQAGVIGDPSVASDTLNFVGRLENNQQGALRAQAALKENNMLQLVWEIELPGTIVYRAGQTVQVSDWGVFAGLYLIEETEHFFRARGGGYRTKLLLRTPGPASDVGVAAADTDDP